MAASLSAFARRFCSLLSFLPPASAPGHKGTPETWTPCRSTERTAAQGIEADSVCIVQHMLACTCGAHCITRAAQEARPCSGPAFGSAAGIAGTAGEVMQHGVCKICTNEPLTCDSVFHVGVRGCLRCAVIAPPRIISQVQGFDGLRSRRRLRQVCGRRWLSRCQLAVKIGLSVQEMQRQSGPVAGNFGGPWDATTVRVPDNMRCTRTTRSKCITTDHTPHLVLDVL